MKVKTKREKEFDKNTRTDRGYAWEEKVERREGHDGLSVSRSDPGKFEGVSRLAPAEQPVEISVYCHWKECHYNNDVFLIVLTSLQHLSLKI
jgi:hypothetical protein